MECEFISKDSKESDEKSESDISDDDKYCAKIKNSIKIIGMIALNLDETYRVLA